MTTFSKIQIVALTAAVAMIVWQLRQSATQRAELASVQTELANRQRELDSGQATLDELIAKNKQLQETETRAGNQTLISVMRERAALTRAAAESAPQNRTVGAALAQTLDSPEHQAAEQEHLRNQVRSGMGTFFRLAKSSPEQIEQYVDLSVDEQRRKAARLSALIHNKMAVADAIRERDNDQQEFEKRKQQVLGDEGYQFLNGIAEGMRNDEAKRLLKLIQENMGGNPLTPEQGERLQPLIKSEIVSINMDDIETFRPPDEWAQQYLQRLENIRRSAGDFLSPAQLETLKAIAAYDLADRQKRMASRRQSLQIN